MKEFLEQSMTWDQRASRNYVGKQNNPQPSVPVRIVNSTGHGITAGQIMAINKPVPNLAFGVQGAQGPQSTSMNMNQPNTEFLISSILFDCTMVTSATRQIVVSAGNIPAGESGLGFIAGCAVAVVRVDDKRRLNTNTMSPDAQYGYCDFVPNCPNLILSDGGFKIIWMSVDFEGPQGYQGSVGPQGYQSGATVAQYVTAVVDLSSRGGRVDYTVFNTDSSDIPDFSFVEVDGLATSSTSGFTGPQGYLGTAVYKVKKPSADSISNVLCVSKGIKGNQYGRASMSDEGGGIRVRWDYDGSTVPKPGDKVGTFASGYQAKLNGQGFVVLGAYPVGNQSAVPTGNQAESVLHVRPFNAAGASQLTFTVRNTGLYDIPACRFVEIYGYQSGYQNGQILYPDAYLGRVPTIDNSMSAMVTLTNIPGTQGQTGAQAAQCGTATYDSWNTGLELEYSGAQGNQQGWQGYQGWQGTEIPNYGRRVGTGAQMSVGVLGNVGFSVIWASGYQGDGSQGAQGICRVRPQW